MMRNVLFLDRDGVINEDLIGDYIKRPADFHFIDGSLKALKQLQDFGYELIVISNQAGIGDGEFTEEALREVTGYMKRLLGQAGIRIAGIYYCLHGKNEGCACRKPEAGLFKQAAIDFQFNKQNTYFIGDKISDVEAGIRFGIKTIFLLTGHGMMDQNKFTDQIRPDHVFADLKEAAAFLTKTPNSEKERT